MSKKNKTFIVLAVIILIAVFVSLWVFRDRPTDTDTEDIVNGRPSGFSPFGTFEEGSGNGPEDLSSSGDGRAGFGGGGSNDDILGPLVIRNISRGPVSGASFALVDGQEVVRYVMRDTGHLFDANTTSTAQKRITNTTLPGIQEVVWITKDRLLLRYLNGDTIETFLASVESSNSGDGELRGSFLEQNILGVAPSPDGASFFSLKENADGGTLGTVTNLFSGTESSVFSSPLREWLVSWPSQSRLLLNAKPGASVDGQLLSLNTSTGGLTRVLSDISGLTTLSAPDGQNILYSESFGRVLRLYNYSTKQESATEFATPTLPEKCVWVGGDTPSAYCGVPKALPPDMPDLWYQGSVSLSDNVWRLDPDGGEAQIVWRPQDDNLDIDVLSLVVNASGTRLGILNKKDLSLWLLNLPSI